MDREEVCPLALVFTIASLKGCFSRAAERYNDLTPADLERRRQRGWGDGVSPQSTYLAAPMITSYLEAGPAAGSSARTASTFTRPLSTNLLRLRSFDVFGWIFITALVNIFVQPVVVCAIILSLAAGVDVFERALFLQLSSNIHVLQRTFIILVRPTASSPTVAVADLVSAGHAFAVLACDISAASADLDT